MHFIARKPVIVISIIMALGVASNMCFVLCTTPFVRKSSDPQVCRNCHQAITDSFLTTAHYFDSRPADSLSIKGSFEEGHNRYRYNPFMEVVMYKDEGKYMQTALVNGMVTTSASFDFVIGSGRNGQTYLTWVDNKLFQLPVSYYVPANGWANSPGFPNYAFFGRQVPANCLECHATKIKVLSYETMEFDPSSVVYGITCQRCHPGANQHAAFHTANPREKESKFVVNAARLHRQARMDACALCHSGFRTAKQAPFSFTVGDTLEKYSVGQPVSKRADTLDVHGNQYGLLAASPCYIKSTTMDCSSCHNVHQTEYKNPQLFSSRCISCHQTEKHNKLCSFNAVDNEVKSTNCIDCHMPVLASKKILLNVESGEPLKPDYLRTHYISIYKDATAEFVKNLKKDSKKGRKKASKNQ